MPPGTITSVHDPTNPIVAGVSSSGVPTRRSGPAQPFSIAARFLDSAAAIAVVAIASGHWPLPALFTAAQHFARSLDFASRNLVAALPTVTWHLLTALSLLSLDFGSVGVSAP